MDADYDGTGFRLQKIKAPCCSAELTLNSLVYDWECGFGVFAINVTNPNIERLPDEGLTEIAGLFGAACRAIYAHY